MTGYIVRRLLLAIPVLFGIVFVVFTLVRLIPGDPCRAALGERATDEICDAYMERRGLNESIPVQFVSYLGELIRGDLGDSYRQGRPVTEMLIERLPVTIELAVMALLFAVCVGIPLGILSAYRQNSSVDVGTMVVANIGVSMPVFWLGLMLQFIFAVVLKNTALALPPSGRLSAG
jgi:peptide/nickel transport system permease protein